MLVPRTFKERTFDKIKVGLLTIPFIGGGTLLIRSGDPILGIFGIVLMVATPFLTIPIGLFLLNVNTDYWKEASGTTTKERIDE